MKYMYIGKTVSMTTCTFVCASCALWVCNNGQMQFWLQFWDLIWPVWISINLLSIQRQTPFLTLSQMCVWSTWEKYMEAWSYLFKMHVKGLHHSPVSTVAALLLISPPWNLLYSFCSNYEEPLCVACHNNTKTCLGLHGSVCHLHVHTGFTHQEHIQWYCSNWSISSSIR